MDASDANRRLEERNRQWIARYPAELQPLAKRVLDERRVAVYLITWKNRARMNWPTHRVTEALDRLVEEEKEVCRDLEAGLAEALRASRGADRPALGQD